MKLAGGSYMAIQRQDLNRVALFLKVKQGTYLGNLPRSVIPDQIHDVSDVLPVSTQTVFYDFQFCLKQALTWKHRDAVFNFKIISQLFLALYRASLERSCDINPPGPL